MSDPGTELMKDVAKAAATEIVRPAQEIVSDVLGGLIGDRLSNWRKNKPAWQERNQRDIAEQAAKLLADRGVSRAAESTNPVNVEEILDASQNTTDPTLKELYAKLVAAAMDPGRINTYRREFLKIASELEPLDALTLPMLDTTAEMDPTRRYIIASRLNVSEDEVALSFRALARLELVRPEDGGLGARSLPALTTLGRRFMLAVR